MTEYMGTTENPFREHLVACVADFCELMPELRARYDMTVIMGAMAEHVGAGLKVFLHKSVCEKEAALKLVAIVEHAAASARAARPQIARPAPPAPCVTTPVTGAAAAGTPTTNTSAESASPEGKARQNPTRH